jgi:small subunit ribosomal protein S6
MRPYELVVLLHPDLEIDVDSPIAKLEKLIAAAGGKILKRDNWGKKRLAYPVSKQNFAVYVYFELQLEPLKVRDLEATLRITEEVMRFLTVHKLEPQAKPEKKKDKPTAAAEDKEPVAAAVTEGEK